MTVAAAPRTRPGFYRPDEPFSAAELQTMAAEGVLKHVAADVYAEAGVPEGPALRAHCAARLLSSTLRRDGVLCGETALWVQLGGDCPTAVMLITDGVFRRQVGRHGQWQIHQVPLPSSEVRRVSGVAVTSAPRTAADLFLGIGVAGSRQRLDLLSNDDDATARLRQIGQLIARWDLHPEPLAKRIAARIGTGDIAGPRAERVYQLLQKAQAEET